MNPFLVLKVPPDADDKIIRQAYLQAIKQSPPEADPARFQAVSAAYEKIKDEASRHRYLLFNREPPEHTPLEVYRRYVQMTRRVQPASFDQLKNYLRACSTR